MAQFGNLKGKADEIPDEKTASGNSSSAPKETVAKTEARAEKERASVFTPVTFVCENYPELGFRGVDGKRGPHAKFTNKQYTAKTPEELEHIRKLMRDGTLSQHGVREINRAAAEAVAKAYMAERLNQGRAVKGGFHSAAGAQFNPGAELAKRDNELRRQAGPQLDKVVDSLAKDGLVLTEAGIKQNDTV